jgi:hypothetical protein
MLTIHEKPGCGWLSDAQHSQVVGVVSPEMAAVGRINRKQTQLVRRRETDFSFCRR